GGCSASMFHIVRLPPPDSMDSLLSSYPGAGQNILSINANALAQPVDPGTNSWRWFDGEGDYSEPVILGSLQPPASASDYPTLLFLNYAHVPPAVSDPAVTGGDRLGPTGTSVQGLLNDLVAHY